LVAVLGHCYSVFLQGNGGKGVASAFGVCLALSCSFATSVLAVWLMSLYLTKKSSASALIALTALLPLNWYFDIGQSYLFLALITLIVWQHKENIHRLRTGGA
jgi:glycerol-3-phosphate acyltransferase PlsY